MAKFAISTQSKVCINEGDALPALLFNFVMRICQENQERLKVNGTHRVYDNCVSLLGEYIHTCRGADKSLARPTSRCILFDGENILFDASLVIYINSTNISPIMIINRIYEHQNLLSL